jgi:E3 ubiquitin-protein ligase SHPRH
VTTLQWQADGGNERARMELGIVERELSEIQEISSAESKALAELEREQELFRTTMNQRLEFYRQLQHISDTVAPWREELDEELDVATLQAQGVQEESAVRRLATFRTKKRFLLHLRNENNQEGERICVICQAGFEVGVLTICGHQYCKECIRLWWHQHRNCPVSITRAALKIQLMIVRCVNGNWPRLTSTILPTNQMRYRHKRRAIKVKLQTSRLPQHHTVQYIRILAVPL